MQRNFVPPLIQMLLKVESALDERLCLCTHLNLILDAKLAIAFKMVADLGRCPE